MRVAAPILALVALVTSGAGCQGRTEILLGLATDLRAGDQGQLDQIQLDVSRAGVPVLSVPFDVPGGVGRPYVLPGTYGLFADPGVADPIDVTVTAFKNGRALVTREAVLPMQPGQVLFYRMAMVAACETTTCPSDQTCIEGRCRARVVGALPLHTEGLEARFCDSGTRFLSTEDNSAVATTLTCPAGTTCQEGACL